MLGVETSHNNVILGNTHNLMKWSVMKYKYVLTWTDVSYIEYHEWT